VVVHNQYGGRKDGRDMWIRSGRTGKDGRTNPRRQTHNGLYTAPVYSASLTASVTVPECRKNTLIHPSLEGSACLYPGLLYILAFMAPFLAFPYPSSFSRSTATCLSIIARLGPPTACRLSTLASKSNTSWTSSPKFG
jgi:hypothetical protein